MKAWCPAVVSHNWCRSSYSIDRPRAKRDPNNIEGIWINTWAIGNRKKHAVGWMLLSRRRFYAGKMVKEQVHQELLLFICFPLFFLYICTALAESKNHAMVDTVLTIYLGRAHEHDSKCRHSRNIVARIVIEHSRTVWCGCWLNGDVWEWWQSPWKLQLHLSILRDSEKENNRGNKKYYRILVISYTVRNKRYLGVGYQLSSATFVASVNVEYLATLVVVLIFIHVACLTFPVERAWV